MDGPFLILQGDVIVSINGKCLCMTAASISGSRFNLTDLADELLRFGNCDPEVLNLSWCCLVSIQHNEPSAQYQISMECLLQLLHDLGLVLHCQFPFGIPCATCADVSMSCNKQNMWCPQLVSCITWSNIMQISWKTSCNHPIDISVPFSYHKANRWIKINKHSLNLPNLPNKIQWRNSSGNLVFVLLICKHNLKFQNH